MAPQRSGVKAPQRVSSDISTGVAIVVIAFTGTLFYHYFHTEGVIIFSGIATVVTLYLFRHKFLDTLYTIGQGVSEAESYLKHEWEVTKRSQGVGFRPNPDRYQSLEELVCDLRDHGLESINMIVGVDFTLSNIENGKRTNKGRSLHDLSTTRGTPYQRVLNILWKTLKNYDDDGIIPTYMFGDTETTNRSVQPLAPDTDDARCQGGDGISAAYVRRLTEGPCELSGPTNFAPLIRKAIEIAKVEQSHHLLIIVTDGVVVNRKDTERAIIEASQYPISIVAVGVGDADFGMMEDFDDKLPQRTFDNFQFVNWTAIITKARGDDKRAEIPFAVAALQEIPDQIAAIKHFGLI